MKIIIYNALGTVRIDVSTDPDHLAKYGLYLWRKLPSGDWEQIKDSIKPEYSHTADPQDHYVIHSPSVLAGCWLQLGAKVNALTPQPGPLDLQIKVYQDPGPPGTGAGGAGAVTAYRVAHTKPVMPGNDLNLTADYEFDLQ